MPDFRNLKIFIEHIYNDLIAGAKSLPDNESAVYESACQTFRTRLLYWLKLKPDQRYQQIRKLRKGEMEKEL